MAIKLSVHQELDILILIPEGSLLESIDGQPIMNAIENHPEIVKVIVDCSKIKHLNSTGINCLLKIFTQLKNRNGKLLLCSLTNHIEKLLIITKLHAVFLISADLEEASNQLKIELS